MEEKHTSTRPCRTMTVSDKLLALTISLAWSNNPTEQQSIEGNISLLTINKLTIIITIFFMPIWKHEI